jgi:hypothetical protein
MPEHLKITVLPENAYSTAQSSTSPAINAQAQLETTQPVKRSYASTLSSQLEHKRIDKNGRSINTKSK